MEHVNVMLAAVLPQLYFPYCVLGQGSWRPHQWQIYTEFAGKGVLLRTSIEFQDTPAMVLEALNQGPKVFQHVVHNIAAVVLMVVASSQPYSRHHVLGWACSQKLHLMLVQAESAVKQVLIRRKLEFGDTPALVLMHTEQGLMLV